MNLLRYPGGKTKLQNLIVRSLSDATKGRTVQYREPFFGGGGIGLAMLDLPTTRSMWLNDKDPGIAALWTAVIRSPGELQGRVLAFEPSVDAFDAFKGELLAVEALPAGYDALVDIGFKKLALHQMSFSGLGVMSGGPLGGRAQTSEGKIDSRWNPGLLCRKIDQFHRLLASHDPHGGCCTCVDFAALVRDESCPAVLYLDPPYVEQGDKLYQCGFTVADHLRLATLLRETPHPWVLSYDDCPLVRDCYSWADVGEVAVHYSVGGARRTSELLITPRRRRASISVAWAS